MSRNKEINKLRLAAMAGSAVAAAALQQLLAVPSYMQRGFGVRDYHKNNPKVMTTHITAKTHRGIPCKTTITALPSLEARVARLQMLKDRKNA